jgi:hypothetical protein
MAIVAKVEPTRKLKNQFIETLEKLQGKKRLNLKRLNTEETKEIRTVKI